MRGERYISWEDVYGRSIDSKHEDHIRAFIYQFSREKWIKLISSIAIDPLWHDFDLRWEELQKKYLQKSWLAIHRRSLLLLVQYVYSSENPLFKNKNGTPTKVDLQHLFLRLNSVLNENERVDSSFSILVKKKMFFHFAKTVQTSFNYGDIKATAVHFENMYNYFSSLKTFAHYDQAFEAEFGVNIERFVSSLKLAFIGDATGDLLSVARKVCTIKVEDIESSWKKRAPELPIPLEYNFIYANNTIDISGNLYTVDWQFLIEALTKAAYDYLLGLDRSLKGDLGSVVFEPALKVYLTKLLVDEESSREIKVSNKRFEYGDFGVLKGDTIYLFEIKSTKLNLKSRFSSQLKWFYSELDNKLIESNGVSQQTKKLQQIDKDLGSFCTLASIPEKRYKIVPILLVYDEFLQAFWANWYFNYRFSLIKSKYRQIDIPNCYTVITFNELYFLSQTTPSKKERLRFLLDYSNREKDDFRSFRVFFN